MDMDNMSMMQTTTKRRRIVVVLVFGVIALVDAFFPQAMSRTLSLEMLRDQSKRTAYQQEKHSRGSNSNTLSTAMALKEKIEDKDNNRDCRSPNQTNATALLVQPDKVELPRDVAYFLHIGKGGGGSIRLRTRFQWNVLMDQCHADPCTIQKSKTLEDTPIAISIRDPIDRLVSAFYWRAKLLCSRAGFYCSDPNNVTQYYSPERREKKQENMGGEARALFITYQQNVSALAEALCPPNETDATSSFNDTAYLEAWKSLKKIRHAQHSIQNWLETRDDWIKEPRLGHLFPIVLEKGFDLNEQVDDYLYYVVARMNRQQSSSNTTNSFASTGDGNNVSSLLTDESMRQRQEYIRCGNNNKEEDAEFQKEQKIKKHSGSGFAAQHGAPLSDRGRQCLAFFYRRDYEIMRLLQEKSCKNEPCRLALQSILDRRAPLLAN